MQREWLLLGARSRSTSSAAFRLSRVQLEIEVEQLFQKVTDGAGPIVERDRFLSDHQRGVCQAGIRRLRGVLEVRVLRVRLDDASGEPAVRPRAVFERDFLVTDTAASRGRHGAGGLRRLAGSAPRAPRRPAIAWRFRAPAPGQPAGQGEVAKLVEIEDIARESQGPLA